MFTLVILTLGLFVNACNCQIIAYSNSTKITELKNITWTSSSEQCNIINFIDKTSKTLSTYNWVSQEYNSKDNDGIITQIYESSSSGIKPYNNMNNSQLLSLLPHNIELSKSSSSSSFDSCSLPSPNDHIITCYNAVGNIECSIFINNPPDTSSFSAPIIVNDQDTNEYEVNDNVNVLCYDDSFLVFWKHYTQRSNMDASNFTIRYSILNVAAGLIVKDSDLFGDNKQLNDNYNYDYLSVTDIKCNATDMQNRFTIQFISFSVFDMPPYNVHAIIAEYRNSNYSVSIVKDDMVLTDDIDQQITDLYEILTIVVNCDSNAYMFVISYQVLFEYIYMNVIGVDGKRFYQDDEQISDHSIYGDSHSFELHSFDRIVSTKYNSYYISIVFDYVSSTSAKTRSIQVISLRIDTEVESQTLVSVSELNTMTLVDDISIDNSKGYWNYFCINPLESTSNDDHDGLFLVWDHGYQAYAQTFQISETPTGSPSDAPTQAPNDNVFTTTNNAHHKNEDDAPAKKITILIIVASILGAGFVIVSVVATYRECKNKTEKKSAYGPLN